MRCGLPTLISNIRFYAHIYDLYMIYTKICRYPGFSVSHKDISETCWRVLADAGCTLLPALPLVLCLSATACSPEKHPHFDLKTSRDRARTNYLAPRSSG